MRVITVPLSWPALGGSNRRWRIISRSWLLARATRLPGSTRGNLLAQADRGNEALDCYDRSLAIAAQRAEVLLNRGNVLSRLGRHAEALSFERALAIDPRQIDAMNGRAIALRSAPSARRGDWQACEQALALKSDHIGALITRGNILLMRQDHSRRSDSSSRCWRSIGRIRMPCTIAVSRWLRSIG